MPIKTLPAVKMDESWYKGIQKEINKFFFLEIFSPLFKELEDWGINPREIQNSSDLISKALQNGQIYYDASYIYGSFSSQLTKELRAIGAKYNASKKAWHLPLSQAPNSFRLAVELSASRVAQLEKNIDRLAGSLQPEILLAKYNFDMGEIAVKAKRQVDSTLKQITVIPELTTQELSAIQNEWEDNLKLYIKDWTDSSIKDMRKMVRDETTKGRRANQIAKIISSKYGQSQKKAEFLAYQEVSLLTSKTHEARYRSSGITRYRWVTSNDERVRKRHQHLDGGIFEFANPPVVDLKTGRTANPGEDFRCRCEARPIIE